MKQVLVTGASGFIGRNMIDWLKKIEDVNILTYGSRDNRAVLESHLRKADYIFHLAGVNRPNRLEEFSEVNVNLTEQIILTLVRLGRSPMIAFASSIQAELDNPYGLSKKAAEELLMRYAEDTGGNVYIFRLPNVFGKWCRPNYNSVVATFCHNIANNQTIVIHDPSSPIRLVYVDDVVKSFLALIKERGKLGSVQFGEIDRTFSTTVGDLAEKLHQIRDIRQTLVLPDLSDPIMKYLQATYLSYLNVQDFAYKPEIKQDQRGMLAELLKSNQFGQIFVSKSHRKVVRGNHYHHSKIEKFCVISGRAIIRFRNLHGGEVLSYEVTGDRIEIVDIPPGYTHSIENVSDDELIVLFWANEIFDPAAPDTYYLEV